MKYTSTKQVFSSWLSLWRTGGQGHHGPVDGPLQIIQQKGDYLKLTNHICEEYELVPQYSMKLTPLISSLLIILQRLIAKLEVLTINPRIKKLR